MIIYPENPVLLVDDEANLVQSFELSLNSFGIENVITCSRSLDVMETVKKYNPELIMLDLTMPGITGEKLLGKISEKYPDITVVVVTGYNDVDKAVECIKAGASDYLVKPVEESRFVSTVKKYLEYNALKRENLALREELFKTETAENELFENIITVSPKMEAVFRYICIIAKSSEPVLVTGETGVGKELIARAVHEAQNRNGKFVPVNTAGIDDNVFSDTIFGHVKGAFTDAYSERKGLIERAEGGTLFLDEIGDLGMDSQVKLLRLIQEKEYYPLGKDTPLVSNANIVAATNKSLGSLIKKNKFRKDLFYRLGVHQINIPPLRERVEDIPLLTEYFVKEAAADFGKTRPSVPDSVLNILENYSFPGNVRELRSIVYDAVSMNNSGELSPEFFISKLDVSPDDIRALYPCRSSESVIFTSSVLPCLNTLEMLLIKEAMKRTGNNQSKAAKLVGISRQTLIRKLNSSVKKV